MILRMMIEEHESPNARTYHALNEAWSEWTGSVMFAPPFHSHLPGWDQIGEVGKRLLYPIFQSHGDHLGIVFFHPEHLLLAKLTEIEWKEIDPCVLDASKRIFGDVDVISL